MINKIVKSAEAAVADIHDGATVMIGGFGTAGLPTEFTDALIAQGARATSPSSTTTPATATPAAALLKTKRVRNHLLVPAAGGLARVRRAVSRRRMSSSSCRRAPAALSASAPQARASARSLRRASAPAARGRQGDAQIGDRDYVLEYPIHADFALTGAARRPLG
ncbi:MAG: CoA-transferase [Burkholderiales bacterium]